MTHHQTLTPLFVAIIAGIGMFLSTLDAGIINVAIPSLIQVFNSNLDVVIWTVTLYALIVSATILFFGQLADRIGRLKIYKMGLTMFAIISLFCGLSSNIHTLIIFRALQGLSAAMLQASSIAVITTRLKSADLAKALGILGMIMGLGPMMGPVLGGILLNSIGWQWMFWINIPICLYGIYGCHRLPTTNEELHPHPLNFLNLILFGASLFMLLLGINYLIKNIIVANLLFMGMLILFLIHVYIEKKSPHPTIHYALFKKCTFAAPIIGIIAMGGATAIVLILPPLFFENLKNYQAWQVGFISLSAPLGIVVAARIAAHLTRTFDCKMLMLCGMTLMSIMLLVLTNIKVDWATPCIFLLLFVYGFGTGFFHISTLIYLTSQFPMHKQAFISSLLRMFQNASIALTAAASAMLISMKFHMTQEALLLGIQQSWCLAATMTVLALLALLYMIIRTTRLKFWSSQ